MVIETYTKGNRSLNAHDFYFEDEIQECDGKLNFYMAFASNVDQIFGTHVETNENDHYINVYANLDMKTGAVCEALEITLAKNSDNEYLKYRLSPEEQIILRAKMDDYFRCKKWLGLDLPELSITFQPGYGTIIISSENTTGCEYKDVFTMEDLHEAATDYVENNL